MNTECKGGFNMGCEEMIDIIIEKIPTYLDEINVDPEVKILVNSSLMVVNSHRYELIKECKNREGIKWPYTLPKFGGL
jgi:hypothetical protein